MYIESYKLKYILKIKGKREVCDLSNKSPCFIYNMYSA